MPRAPLTKMSGIMSGDDNCRAFADGTRQQPSYLCYFFVLLLVIGAVTNLLTLAFGTAPPLHAISHTILSGALTYIMYENCVKCNGVRGFLLTFVVVLILGCVINMLLPLR